MKDTIVLAYSGGLDTSVLIKWLQEKYNVDVVTFTMELGQKTDLKKVSEKAKNLGAKKHYSIDGLKEFVENYVFQAIKANALYEEKYPIATALGRPLIVKKLVEIAQKENVPLENTIAIGDAINDISMFEVAGVSIAFNSSCNQLKSIATYVVDSNDLSEVLEILKKYIEGL